MHLHCHINLALTISRNCEGFPQFPQDFTFFSSCLRSLGGKSVSKYFPQLSQSLFLQNLLKGKHASFKLNSHTRDTGDPVTAMIPKKNVYFMTFCLCSACFTLYHISILFVGIHNEESTMLLNVCKLYEYNLHTHSMCYFCLSIV